MNNNEVFVGKKSGFISFKSNKLSLALNIYGHQQLYWDDDIIDPRLVGSIPFWMCYNTKSLIPAIPYSHGFFASIPRKIPFSGRICRLIDSIYRWKVNLSYTPGFLSYVKYGNSLLINQGFSQSKVNNLNNGIIIKGSCPLWEIPKFSIKVLIRFLSKFKSIFNIPIENESLIKKSGIDISKTIFISDEVLYIRECYNQTNLNGLCLIPFTFRTFADVKIKYLKDFVCFISENNGTFIAVSIFKDELLRKKNELYSSTGKVIIWEFIKKKNKITGKTVLSRIIIANAGINKINEIKSMKIYQEILYRIVAENDD